MPTYEFRCPNGHGFERFYKTMSTAVAELPCPECSATATRQLSAGAGLVFKGSGFYLTDYGKNAHRGSEPKTGKSEGKSEGGGKTEGGGKAEGGSKTAGGTSEGGKSESSSKSDGGSSKTSSDAKPVPKSDTAKSSSRPKSE